MEKENAKKSSDAVLSESQVAEFHERGYLIADFDLDESMLVSIKEKLQPLYPEDYQRNPTLPARIQDGWKTVDEVRQLARNANIAAATGSAIVAISDFEFSHWHAAVYALRHDPLQFNTEQLYGWRLGGLGGCR